MSEKRNTTVSVPEKRPITSVRFGSFLTKTISDREKRIDCSHRGKHLRHFAEIRKFISFSIKKQLAKTFVLTFIKFYFFANQHRKKTPIRSVRFGSILTKTILDSKKRIDCSHREINLRHGEGEEEEEGEEDNLLWQYSVDFSIFSALRLSSDEFSKKRGYQKRENLMM